MTCSNYLWPPNTPCSKGLLFSAFGPQSRHRVSGYVYLGPDPYGNGSCKITIDSEGYHEEPRVLIVTVKDPQILRENNDCFCRNISAVPAQRVIATQWENNRIGTSQILPDLGFSQNDVGCFFFSGLCIFSIYERLC